MFVLKNLRLLTLFTSSSIAKEMLTNKAHLTDIFLKGVEAVQPKNLLRNTVRIEDNNLFVQNNVYKMTKPCHVVGFGKAVLGMAVELERILGAAIYRGVVTVPVGIFETFKQLPELLPAENSRFTFIEGASNNLPDANAHKGALLIKELICGLKEDDILIVLISGGGSALLPLPKAPITLEEKSSLIKSLSKAGANILELNTVRKKLSELKGGGLAALAKPAKVISLILSDIVDDPLDFIASGPTVLNIDKPSDALNIVKKYGLYDALSGNIKHVLNEKNMVDTSEDFESVRNLIIGNNKIACEAAANRAKELDYQTVILTTCIANDVEVLSRWYARLIQLIMNRARSELRAFLEAAGLKDVRPDEILNLDPDRAICMVSGGEPTVVVKGDGRGGRNQELALRLSLEVNKLDAKTAYVSFLSAGTDGMDGPTDAAGAMGSSNLVDSASLHGINPTSFLSTNDSYGFYSEFNDGDCLIKTGHTGTNVMDLHIIIINPCEKD